LKFNSPTYKFIFHYSDLDFNKVKNLLRLIDGEINYIKTPNNGCRYSKPAARNITLRLGALPYEEKLFGSGGGR
jgi:hypothetical protein